MVSWCNKFDAANGKEGVHTICITFMAGTLVMLVTFRLASVRMSIMGAPVMAGPVGAVPSQRRALKISVRGETHPEHIHDARRTNLKRQAPRFAYAAPSKRKNAAVAAKSRAASVSHIGPPPERAYRHD
jgi:hypothetical protein